MVIKTLDPDPDLDPQLEKSWITICIKSMRIQNPAWMEQYLGYKWIFFWILVRLSHCLSYLVHRTFFFGCKNASQTKNSCTCPYKHHMCVRMVCEHCCQMWTSASVVTTPSNNSSSNNNSNSNSTSSVSLTATDYRIVSTTSACKRGCSPPPTVSHSFIQRDS